MCLSKEQNSPFDGCVTDIKEYTQAEYIPFLIFKMLFKL
jgi:hypothetical protein